MDKYSDRCKRSSKIAYSLRINFKQSLKSKEVNFKLSWAGFYQFPLILIFTKLLVSFSPWNYLTNFDIVIMIYETHKQRSQDCKDPTLSLPPAPRSASPAPSKLLFEASHETPRPQTPQTTDPARTLPETHIWATRTLKPVCMQNPRNSPESPYSSHMQPPCPH